MQLDYNKLANRTEVRKKKYITHSLYIENHTHTYHMPYIHTIMHVPKKAHIDAAKHG